MSWHYLQEQEVASWEGSCLDGANQQTRTSDNVALPERQMRELALFAGAGGGILGGKLLGWRCVCAVEIDPYARKVLLSRQADGCLEPFPIWDDVTTFDGHRWRGSVDVVSGGFPCQDISSAGKGAGIDGKRSGLWSEMARIVEEVRPVFVWVENSPLLVRRGLARILGDLAKMGYDAKWGVVGADDAGAPHRRKRIWIVAYSHSKWQLQQERVVKDQWRRPRRSIEKVSDPMCPRPPLPWEITQRKDRREAGGNPTAGDWWATEPNVVRMVHGVPARMDRIRAIGNGQVPAVVRLAWETLANED